MEIPSINGWLAFAPISGPPKKLVLSPCNGNPPCRHIGIFFGHGWIWVNDNISLTWIVRPFGDDSPYTNYDSSEGEQWGRDEIYPEIYIYITKEMDMILMYINGILYDISWYPMTYRNIFGTWMDMDHRMSQRLQLGPSQYSACSATTPLAPQLRQGRLALHRPWRGRSVTGLMGYRWKIEMEL